MKVLIGLLVLPWSTILRGLVLTRLWHWFVVPLGVPDLNIPLALGISLIASFLTLNPAAATKECEWWVTLGTSIVISLAAWGMGAIFHLFL